jgi:hypothetical protein
MRPRLALITVIVVAALAPAAASTHLGCRGGNPMANVYLAFRLEIIDRCAEVSGVVV